MSGASRPPEYFERIYAGNPDPWEFETSHYEREKYDATIAALGGRHFANAMEVGCSIGVLTHRLAGRCEQLLAVDIVETALARAKARCAKLGNIKFENRLLPRDWPAGETFDLIVLSEVLYFLNPGDIHSLAALATASLAPGGYALLVNYTETIDEPCSGNDAAEIFCSAASELTRIRQVIQPKYRIDLFASDIVPGSGA